MYILKVPFILLTQHWRFLWLPTILSSAFNFLENINVGTQILHIRGPKERLDLTIKAATKY